MVQQVQQEVPDQMVQPVQPVQPEQMAQRAQPVQREEQEQPAHKGSRVIPEPLVQQEHKELEVLKEIQGKSV